MYLYSVLTCIFGDSYEKLHEIEDPKDYVEYVCVTDNPNLTSNTWKIYVVDEIYKMMPFTNQWVYVRYHPYEFVSSDICLYVDGSIVIKKDLYDTLIKSFIRSKADYGVMVHSDRRTIYDECDTWVKYRKFSVENSEYIKSFLYDRKYNINTLFQSTIILSKNTQITSFINNSTYRLCKVWSLNDEVDRINQIELTYIINTNFFNSDKIFLISPNIFNSDYINWCSHVSDYINRVYNFNDEHFVFDRYYHLYNIE